MSEPPRALLPHSRERKGQECVLLWGSLQKQVLGTSLGKPIWLVLPSWWPLPASGV